VAVPTHRRGVGLLGQEPLLFPHLTALQNVAFGARAQRPRAGQAGALAQEWLDAVGLAGFEHRRPGELSGGQQQRAAIARALAAEPDLLLLDEPMASLDVESASLIRTLLRDRLSSTRTTTVLVTHDVVDAIVLADRVVILDGGRVADGGTPATVLGRPVNGFAASLAGLNLLRGVVTLEGSGAVAAGRIFAGSGDPPTAGSDAFVAFPRSAVSVREPEPGRSGHAANAWSGSVELLEPAAGGIRIVLAGDEVVAEVPSTEVFAHRLGAGSPVALFVDPAFVTVYATRPAAIEGARMVR
jgi:molybdate transport system ATP-binding protein